MADEMNQNVAILSLVAALKDNTKELTANVKKQITQVEKNAGEINFTGNTEDIQKKLKEIVGLLNKELKGVNTAKYLQPILEVFSDATKSAEEYTAAVDETINSMKDLAKIGTGTSAKIRKGIKEGLPHLNQRDIAKALTLQKKLEEAIIKSEEKISQAKEKYKGIEASSLTSLRKSYKAEEKYISSIGDEAVSNLASKMGIQSPSSDITRDLKEFSELISLFEILKQKKEELSNSKFDLTNEEELKKAQSTALENVGITKTLASLYDQIEQKREKLSSKYNIQDTIIGLPENYQPINIRDILTVNNDYVEKIKEETKKSIDKAENELALHVKERAEKRKASADAEFNKSMQSLNKTTTGSTRGTGKAKDGIENIGEAADNAKGNVDDLGEALGDLGDSKGSSSGELDLWAESAKNLGEEFKDVVKYAVDAETALEKIQSLNKVLNKRTLSVDEEKDLVGFSQRYLALGKDLSEDQEDTFYDVADNHKKMVSDITKMTEAQLVEIEKLKAAQKEVSEQSTPPASNTEKQTKETTEEIEKLAKAEKEAADQANNLESNLENSFTVSKNEISDLIALVQDLANKLGSADFAENLVKNQNELSNVFKEIANDFGDSLNFNITEFADNLDSTTKEKFSFDNIRNELLNIVQQFQNSLQSVGLSSTQLDEAYKMIKGWNDADSYSSMKVDVTTGERGAFLNSKTGQASNSFFVDSTKSFGDVLFGAIKELSVGLDQEISSIYDTWVHSHPFRKTIEGLKTIGSDVGFSVADLELGIDKLLKDKLPNMLLTNNYKFTNLDLSDVSEEITKKFLDEYKKELLNAGLEENLIDGQKKIVFPSKLAKHDGVYDLDKKSSILNGALLKAMSTIGIDSSKLTTGDISDLKVDLSKVYEEEQKVTQKGQDLLNVIDKITGALKEIKDNTFKFDGLDSLISNLEEVKILLNEISTSLKSGINISSLSSGFKEVEKQAKETATAISDINQPEVLSGTPLPSPTLFEDESGQLSFIEQAKKAIDLIEEESGQMGMFENIAEKATDSAIEGQMTLNDILNKNIDGQMSLNDLQKKDPIQQDISMPDVENIVGSGDDVLEEWLDSGKTAKDFIQSHTSDLKVQTDVIEENTEALKENRQEQENNSNVKTDQPETLRKRLESIFENAQELKKVLKSLDEGTSFSFDWSDDDGYQKINLFKKALKEFGYTVKDVKEDTDSFSYSGKIVPINEEPKKIDDVAEAYKEVTKTLKKYYDLKQKEYSKGNVEDNDTLKSYKEELKDAIAHIGKYTAITEEAIKAQKRFDEAIANYKNSFSGDIQADLNSKISKYENKKNKTAEYEETIEKIRNQINELKVPIDFTNPDEIKQLESAENQIKNMMKNLDSREFDLIPEDKVNNLLTSAYKSLNKDTAAPKELRDRLKEVIAELERLRKTGEEVDGLKFDKLQSEIKELQLEMQKTGKTGASMGDKIKNKFKDVAAYYASFVSIQDGIQVLRQGFETIKEYDTALTEMNKVSDESIQTLKEFQKESFNLANNIGATASQIQNSTADWMRLGESLEEAKQSAQDATILFNVSEFGSIDEATDSLVSMSQAFKNLGKGEIIDVVNNLGNNFAISTDGLATALKDSASSLQTAQNDFYESAALVTAANTVVQDPSKVGAGLRTIALRLTGTEAAKEELAALGEDVEDFVVTTTSMMDKQIRDLTKTQGNFGISLLDMNGNYRSTYDILLDIAKVWDKIAEEDLVTGQNRQNALLEMMAGKNRSNILASVLQSPEILEEAYAYALDSEGSAMRENEAYLKSIEAHLAQLKNAWDSLWINENNREVITFFLDLAKGILEAVDSLGVLNTLLLGGGGIFAAIKTIKGDGKWG